MKSLDYSSIYEKFLKLDQEKREEFIDEDISTKATPKSTHEIAKLCKDMGMFKEVNMNVSDDIMNLINVACVRDN